MLAKRPDEALDNGNRLNERGKGDITLPLF